MTATLPRIVIVGAGFTGALVARQLAQSNRALHITLIDQRDYFLFTPRLVDLVEHELAPTCERMSLTALAKRFGYQFRQARVTSVNRTDRWVEQEDGMRVPYDFLVISIGAGPNYFSIPGAQEHSAAYRSHADAVAVRQRAQMLGADSRIVVVGGGPTGAEFAGALRQLTRARTVAVELVSATPELLMGLPTWLRKKTAQILQRQGVRLHFNTPVWAVTGTVVQLADQALSADLVIWAAGVTPNQLTCAPACPVDARGHLLVAADLRIDEQIFAGGDCVVFRDAKIPAPKTAQHARLMGQRISNNILRLLDGRPTKPYRPYSLGTLIRLGPTCLLCSGPVHVSGRLILLLRDILYRQRVYEIIGWPWQR